jgi:hypothetical protein
MTPGRETAAGFFVARRVAAIRWKNDRRGAFWPSKANKPARRERAFAKTAEPLDELCKARLRPCPVFVLLCPCYPRAAAVTERARGRAHFLFSSGGLRGSCGPWVVPALPVFFCYLQGARASDRTTLKLLLTNPA